MANLNLEMPKLKLGDGTEIPALGFGAGTAMFKKVDDGKIDPERVTKIKTAIDVGYRHLDGAEIYNTERELGIAIKESKIPRSEFFVVTKVGNSVRNIRDAIDVSLSKLGLDYVDLYLIHFPFWAESDEELQKAWAEMVQVKASGKARSVGVSNFSKEHIETILATGKEAPSVNQTEYHPYLQRGDMKAFHESKGITLSAYGPLAPTLPSGKPGPLDPLLDKLSRKYAVNEGEILLRWAVDTNVVPVTTSNNEQRLSDMLRIASFKLTPKEVEDITTVGQEKHVRRYWGDKFAADDRS